MSRIPRRPSSCWLLRKTDLIWISPVGIQAVAVKPFTPAHLRSKIESPRPRPTVGPRPGTALAVFQAPGSPGRRHGDSAAKRWKESRRTDVARSMDARTANSARLGEAAHPRGDALRLWLWRPRPNRSEPSPPLPKLPPLPPPRPPHRSRKNARAKPSEAAVPPSPPPAHPAGRDLAILKDGSRAWALDGIDDQNYDRDRGNSTKFSGQRQRASKSCRPSRCVTSRCGPPGRHRS